MHAETTAAAGRRTAAGGAALIDGKAVAAGMRQRLAEEVAALKANGITPGLSVVLVGDDPASAVYVRNKQAACEEIGMKGETIRMRANTTQAELIEIVQKLLVEIEPALRRRPGASFAAAMLFFGTINWTHTWFNPKGPVSAGALAEMAVDLTLGGVRKAAD